MSNEITAFFKGRKGVAESVYQYDYGMVLVIDGLDFVNNFDCYFSTSGEDEAIPAIGSDNRVAIPNDCLTRAGDVTLHIPSHTGENDSEIEYVVTFKVIGRARPVDDGTEEEQSAVSKAIALLNHTNSSVIETIDAYLDENADSSIQDWLDDHPEATTTVQDGAITDVKLSNSLKQIVKKKNVFAHASFLYEELANCAEPENGFGLCGVLWDDNTCIVNDFGAGADGSTLVNFLEAKGISKVDAVVVSHYHGDHINMTSLNALMNSGIDLSHCTFYLPHKNINWASFIGSSGDSPKSIQTAVKTALANNEITYIEPDAEGFKAEVGDFTLEFYNVDSSYYTDYYPYKYYSKGSYETESTRYNNFSMCTNINIGGTNFFLTGDIEYPAQEKMAMNVARADVYQIPHHGRNLKESQSLINNLSCKIGVIAQYCDINGSSTNGILAPSAGRCRELGTLVSTLNNDVNIVVDGGRVYTDSTNDVQNGECIGHIIQQGTDFDDLGIGEYFVSRIVDIETFSNSPYDAISFQGTATIKVEPLNNGAISNNRIIQTAIIREFGIMQRIKLDTWSDWRILSLRFTPASESGNTLDYSDAVYVPIEGKISPSAIRGIMPTGTVTDFNKAYLTGFYDTESSADNMPSDTTSAGFLFVMSSFSGGGNFRCVQLWVPFDYDMIKMRRCQGDPRNASNWKTWKTITPA